MARQPSDAPTSNDRREGEPANRRAGVETPEQSHPRSNGDAQPSAGLDEKMHAAAQRHAHQAEILRQTMFPGLMAAALSLDKFVDSAAFKVYLERVREDAGCTSDPIQSMLVEQFCLAHFRVAQLQIRASQAEGLDALKVLNAAAARLLGEMRRTALSLHACRSLAPKGESGPHIRLFKEAK